MQKAQGAQKSNGHSGQQERDVADWRRIEVDTGGQYQVDLNPVYQNADGSADIVVYADQTPTFDPRNMKRWIFTCRGYLRVLTDAGFTPAIYVPRHWRNDQGDAQLLAGATAGPAHSPYQIWLSYVGTTHRAPAPEQAYRRGNKAILFPNQPGLSFWYTFLSDQAEIGLPRPVTDIGLATIFESPPARSDL